MEINRVWCMPNKNTFDIKPIKELIQKYTAKLPNNATIVDPFANKNKFATITNDLDPQYETDYHMDAHAFLQMLDEGSVDLLLNDPPYSARQISESYKKLGQSVNMETTQASYWGNIKKEARRIVKKGGYVITCSWNSGGIGKKNGFEIVEILLVPHGGWHNDTIVVVERKIQEMNHNMKMYAVKNGQFDGVFFDKENLGAAIGDKTNAEIKNCNTYQEAIEFLWCNCNRFYAVQNGRINGIFTNWPDCQVQTTRFAGAKFKSFYSITDAIEYVNEGNKTQLTEVYTSDMPDSECFAFVDGSFNKEKNEYGWGAVMYFNKEKYFLSGSGNDPEDAQLRNVAGEILGVQRAIEEAIERGYKQIDIYYDYLGIEMWATNQWKRNKKQTIAYYNFIKETQKKISINFYKVKSHTGIELNELADKLAKEACGL